MTDEQIIKALEKTIKQCVGDCNRCKYTRVFMDESCPFRAVEYAYYLITRQQARIKKLEERTKTND